MEETTVTARVPKPKWLRVKLPTGESFRKVRSLVDEHKLHTICESGSCPNMGECWGEGTATFMILGNICTRSCGFCAVATGRPDTADPFEPARVAKSIKYDRSLEVLRRLAQAGMRTKSGVMLGLGESETEVLETMDDLISVGVDILTLGQYLQPTTKHLPVKEFITPEKFAEYKEIGLKKGFRYVESGPLVRSSYHAEKHIFEK
jgi:lipoate synthase